MLMNASLVCKGSQALRGCATTAAPGYAAAALVSLSPSVDIFPETPAAERSGFARFLQVQAEASAEAAGAEAAQAEESESFDEGGVEVAGFVAAMFSNQLVKMAGERLRRGGHGADAHRPSLQVDC